MKYAPSPKGEGVWGMRFHFSLWTYNIILACNFSVRTAVPSLTCCCTMNVSEFNACVDEHSDGLYRFILKNIKDEDKARDVVQDAFEKMWKKVDTIEASKAKSYLFTTAYHCMIDDIRKHKREQPLDAVNDDVAYDSNHYTGAREIVNTAVQQLPEVQRSVLMLRDYEGYSYKEIGEITSLSEAQVKAYIYRARMFLKNYIGSLEKVI
jgi:RNA polymerase sigma-70 factor (ECF subfamily)